MKFVRTASYREYVEWYLRREARKVGVGELPAMSACQTPSEFANTHPGKIREWFPEAAWSLVEIHARAELETLIFIDDTRSRAEGLVKDFEKPDYRLLRKVSQNAIESEYLARFPCSPIRGYYRALTEGKLALKGLDRLVICAPNTQELAENPGGTCYLHDGAARGLAAMLALRDAGESGVFPIEAYCCEWQLQRRAPDAQ